MSVQFVDSNNTLHSSETAWVGSIPGGANKGDLLLAIVEKAATVSGSITFPGGWTKIGGDIGNFWDVALAYKIMEQGDPSTISVNAANGVGAATSGQLTILAFRGVDPITPFLEVGTLAEGGSTNSATHAVSLTNSPGAHGAFVVSGMSVYATSDPGVNIVPASGFNELSESYAATIKNEMAWKGGYSQAPGTLTMTTSAAVSRVIAWAVSFNEARDYDLIIRDGTVPALTATPKFGSGAFVGGTTVLGQPNARDSAQPDKALRGDGKYTVVGSRLGTGTVEFWMKRNGAPSGVEIIVGHDASWQISLDATTGLLRLRWGGAADPPSNTITSLASVCDNSYHHVAAVFVDGMPSLYIDGNRDSFSTVKQASTFSISGVLVGGWQSGSSKFSGSLDELSFSRVAQYTGATFTPPTTAFANNRAGQFAVYHFDGSVANSAVTVSGRGTPQYVGQVLSGVSGTPTSHTVNLAVPGMQAGDLMLAWVQTMFTNGETWSGPGGWTKLQETHSDRTSVALFYKFAVGGETTDTFTTDIATGDGAVYRVFAYRGVDRFFPIADWATDWSPAGNTKFESLPGGLTGQLRVGVTSASVNVAGGFGYIRFDPPTGWTSRVNDISTGYGGRGGVIEWADVPITVDGDTDDAIAVENDNVYGGVWIELLLNGVPLRTPTDTLTLTDSVVARTPVVSRATSDTLSTDDSVVSQGLIRIDRIQLSFYVTHTYDADLSFTLLGPGGFPSVAVIDGLGRFLDDFGVGTDDSDRTTLDTDSTAVIQSYGDPPFQGVFGPQNSLAPFQTLQPSTVPDWTLQIIDGAEEDVGTVHVASLIVTVDGVDTRYEGIEPPVDIPDNDPTGTTVHFASALVSPPVTPEPEMFIRFPIDVTVVSDTVDASESVHSRTVLDSIPIGLEQIDLTTTGSHNLNQGFRFCGEVTTCSTSVVAQGSSSRDTPSTAEATDVLTTLVVRSLNLNEATAVSDLATRHGLSKRRPSEITFVNESLIRRWVLTRRSRDASSLTSHSSRTTVIHRSDAVTTSVGDQARRKRGVFRRSLAETVKGTPDIETIKLKAKTDSSIVFYNGEPLFNLGGVFV